MKTITDLNSITMGDLITHEAFVNDYVTHNSNFYLNQNPRACEK